MWFPEQERNLATSIANVASAVGRGVGFFLGPGTIFGIEGTPNLLYPETKTTASILIFSSFRALARLLPPLPPLPSSLPRSCSLLTFPGLVHHAEDMSHLMLVEAGLALLPAIGALYYLPDQPLEPPSAAAAALRSPSALKQARMPLKASLVQLFSDFGATCRNWQFVVLAIAGGLQMGVYGAWSGVLPEVLSDRFNNFQVRLQGLARHRSLHDFVFLF